MKERALKAVAPPKMKSHQFRPDDKLLQSTVSSYVKLIPQNSPRLQGLRPIAAHKSEVNITTLASFLQPERWQTFNGCQLIGLVDVQILVRG